MAAFAGEVAVVELPFDVVRGEGDRGLPDAEGLQIGEGHWQPEFFVDFPHAIGDVLSGVVVPAYGDVGTDSARASTSSWARSARAASESVRATGHAGALNLPRLPVSTSDR